MLDAHPEFDDRFLAEKKPDSQFKLPVIKLPTSHSNRFIRN